MIDNIKHVPFRRRESELYKFTSFLLNYTDIEFYKELNDTDNKYKGPDKISKEAVQAILKEFGLTTIADLLDATENIDFNTIAAYAGYLSLFKGSRTGYETTIRLLGFDYKLLEWWEQSPKGRPNTMAMDLLIDSSTVPKPYETFQKIKKFTAEYVFPIIDPLAYTMSINFAELAFLHLGFAHPTYYHDIEHVSIDEALLYSRSTFILESPDGAKWSIKVNNNGELKAFKTEFNNVTRAFSLLKPNSTSGVINVDNTGNIFAVDSSPAIPLLLDFTITSRNETIWHLKISNTNVVTVSLL